MDISNEFEMFWKEMIRQLIESGDISEKEKDMWFKNMIYISGDNSEFKIQVPSKFYHDQVKQRYLSLMESKLEDLFGKAIKICFDINKKEISEISKQPLSPVNYKKEAKANIEKLPKKEKIAIPKKAHQQLNKDYTFDNFVIGNNNNFAANAALAISANPGIKYNPFLIYGGVGLGKTHLMQSIGHNIYQKTNKKVVYISSENFLNEFVYSIKNSKDSEFKNKYRNVDVLLIDDIHDLQNKDSTQEELFHTFNALYDAKKQMVFTCDRPPSELKNMTDRLKNRFTRGLNVDLQPPSFETKMAILKKKQESREFLLSDELLELICNNIKTNIRDMEASLDKLIGYSELVSKNISVEVAKQQLKEMFTGPIYEQITIYKIQKCVGEYFNVTTNEIKSKKRTKQITYPRQIAMYITREITDFSTTEIGLDFGSRDHTTVMHACKKIEESMKMDPTLEPTIQNLMRTIKES